MFTAFHSDTRLQHLVTHLTHLRQGGVAGGKALHKPVMLLALMDVLEDSRRAKPEFVPIDETLRNRFNETWGKLIPEAKTGDFFKPVFYLPNEGFWAVYTSSNQPADKLIRTLKGAAADGLWSRFNEEYTTLLTSPEVREIVRMVILDTYFPNTKYRYWASHGQAELIAEKEALIGVEERTPKYVSRLQFVQFEGFVRHWKFRENVLVLYDHTCCISGLRAQKEMSHPLVDACHIQDHAKSGIDHPTNGLALCKNLHAAFDSGMIALSNEYRVLVSKDFRESDSGYSLHRLAGQKIRLPDRADYCPDISYIRLHRERWRF